MYKPTFLVLVASMIMLLPFGTSINLSNAMAITEAEYYADPYNKRYTNDDDHYGPEKDQSYSYDHELKFKDKDRTESVSITENNCININNNINGDVLGNVNVGNSKQNSDDRSNGVGANTFGNNDDEGYYDGYKQDKGSSCIVNNNNNNTIIIATGNGNTTAGNSNETDQCAADIEDCFIEFIEPDLLPIFLDALEEGITVEFDTGEIVTLNSFADICDVLEGLTVSEIEGALGDILNEAGLFVPLEIEAFANCVADALGEETDINGIVAPFAIHNEEAEDSSELTALEKITKLKQQWLSQLL